MSNVLTDEEIMSIRNRAKLNDNRQIDPMAFAREIERAVLAKAGEQEPVAWIVRCKRSGLIGQAEPNEKATNPDYWTDSFPVYAHQLPAQAENPLVDAVFAASHKKATDTHGKCPNCSHECAQAIPEWRPIETIPQEIDCLVYIPGEREGKTILVANWHKNVKIIGGVFDFDRKAKPTHWMPLPEPPKY